MSIAELIRRMADAGAPAEAIAIAVEAVEAEQVRIAQKRAQAAARKARQRERERDSHVTVTEPSRDTPPDKESTPTPPKEINPPRVVSSNAGAREGFDRFWQLYPHKVGKRDALKAFDRAATRAPLETIFTGLRRYVEKTDDRPWCNPATWLNQDRWDDAPAEVRPQARGSPPPLREATMADYMRERLKRYDEHGPTIEAGDGDGEGTGAQPALFLPAAQGRR